MMNLRQRLRAATHSAKPALEHDHRRKTPERIEETRRRIIRVCLTTGLGCAVIGGAFLLAGSHTLHQMAVFLFGWSVGCVAVYLNILVQRQVTRGRPPSNS
jgi:hypothetical protein